MTLSSPELFQRIVADMPEAVIVSDRAGVIVFWNRAAEAMFGHSAAEAIGKDLLAVPAIRRDGSRISLEFSIVLLRDDDGELAGAAAIIRDVTARWERERVSRGGASS